MANWTRLFCLLMGLSAAPALAEDEAWPVICLHAVLQEAMRAGPEIGFSGRVALLAPVIGEIYDFPAMARQALGPEAATLPPERLERLAEALARHTVAAYAGRFHAWNGERFETAAPFPAHGGGMLVPARIVPAGGAAERHTYLVRDGRVADVLADGVVSLVAAQRTEFRAVLRQDGAEGVERLLDRRTMALDTEAR